MAISKACNFMIRLQGDGSSTTVALTLATAPVFLNSPNSSPTSLMPTAFDLVTNKPTDVANVYSTDGVVSAAAITALGTTLSLTFSAAPGAGPFTVTGTLVF